MGVNLRDKFLSLDDHTVKTINVEGWGEVRIRSLSAAEMDKAVEFLEKNPNFRGFAFVTTLAVVDEDGKKVFTANDVEKLVEHSHKPLKKIYESVIEMNSVKPEEIDSREKASV